MSLLDSLPVRPVNKGSRNERRAVKRNDQRERERISWASGREFNESGRLQFADAREGTYQEIKERPAEMHPSHVQLWRVERNVVGPLCHVCRRGLDVGRLWAVAKLKYLGERLPIGTGRETSETISVCWQESKAAPSSSPSTLSYSHTRPAFHPSRMHLVSGVGLLCVGKRAPVGGTEPGSLQQSKTAPDMKQQGRHTDR